MKIKLKKFIKLFSERAIHGNAILKTKFKEFIKLFSEGVIYGNVIISNGGGVRIERLL